MIVDCVAYTARQRHQSNSGQELRYSVFFLFTRCFDGTEQLTRPAHNSTVHFSSQICRLQRHLSAGEHQQDLFQSQPTMFVSQHSQPPTQSLVELIQLCGGTVSKTVRQAGICIGKYSGRRPKGSRILSEQWVLGTMFPFVMLF